MPLLPHDTFYLYLYGIINGLFFACFMYVVLFGLSYLQKKEQHPIGFLFLFASVGFASFGCYNLFFQDSYINISSFLTSDSIKLARFAAPIGLVISTYLFIRLSLLKSYRAFVWVKKYRALIYGLYVLNVICFISLFLVSSDEAILINTLLFIPHTALAAYYSVNIFKRKLAPYLTTAFTGLLALACWLAWIASQNLAYFNAQSFFPINLATCLFLLFSSFLTLKYGYDEAKRYFTVNTVNSRQLIYNMYQALEEKQFYLVFQPKVNLATNKPIGFEALLRWQHPKLGSISPAIFIPLAEETGLINHICRWTIEHAVRQARIHHDKGIELPISINFSAKDMHPAIISYLQKTLEKYEVHSHLIMIEITESLLIHMTKHESEALEMLYDMNIPLSMDDYGTGFSSLSYLSKLSLTELKIDGSFIKEIETNRDHLVIVNSTLEMSKGLNLSVVAEGVENYKVANILKDLGCTAAQGYGFAKPMRAGKLQEWLDANN